MLVNELAKASGVEAHVVRYYARIGLLRPARNPENGYQLFDRNDLQRMKRIRQLQALGFSLSEIRRFLEQDRKATTDCRRACLRAGLERNIARNRRRIAELEALQQRMEAVLEQWGADQCRRAPCYPAAPASGEPALGTPHGLNPRAGHTAYAKPGEGR